MLRGFQKRLHQALEGLQGVVCIADDIIIHGKDTETHDQNLNAFLQRCLDVGIKLNKEKLELRTNAITFLGHRISGNGLEADPEKVKAINEMEPPTNVSQLRTYIGMVNYMAKFLPNPSETLKSLTNLTKKDVQWNWSENEQRAFDEVKHKRTSAPLLTFYDPTRPLILENDASEYGLGSTLQQDGRPVGYASRMLTGTEQRYAQIEKEMLAVTFGLEKFHHYTYGRRLQVITDHKPLVSNINKPLSKAPKRLQNMLLRSQMYNYNLVYVPGKDIPVADALSRAPLKEGPTEEADRVHNLTFNSVKQRKIEQIRNSCKIDPEMQELMKVIYQGWPEHKADDPEIVRQYFSFQDELTTQDGIVMRGERLMIPKELRTSMKIKCHAGHLSINATLRRACDLLYWPGMSTDLRNYVETCGVCASMPVKQSSAPIITAETPERPWQKVGSDIFSLGGSSYLITVDYHSSFFEADLLPDISAETVIKKLKKNFARRGIPDILVTDSGTQYTADTFRKFAERWDFSHLLSSPGNHQANGAAEAAVKTVETLQEVQSRW